jgi:hypothetical protein
VTAGAPDRIRPLIFAIVAIVLAFAWQALAVRFVYGGNWTGLFCTGAVVLPPPTLTAENIYLFSGTNGYDGQYYHYIAHDPLLRHGLAQYMDSPRVRYWRILVPGLAAMLAAGQPRYVDAAYISVNLLFLFAGIYWLGRFIGLHGFHPAWAMLYLLAPATVVSLDRLTVDLSLASLTIAFALYVTEQRSSKLYLILALAPLARETGFFLTAAYCLAQLFERRFKRAILYATSAVPALAWHAFLAGRTAPSNVIGWLTTLPLAGLTSRMLNPVHYPASPPVAIAANLLDELALAGAFFSFAFSFWLLRTTWPRPLRLAVILIAVGGLNFSQPFWIEAYAFGRILTPLLVMLALFAVQSRSWSTSLPLVMIVPRVIFEMGGQFIKVARGLFT